MVSLRLAVCSIVLAALGLLSCTPSPTPAASPSSGNEAVSPPSASPTPSKAASSPAPPPPPATPSDVMVAARSTFDTCYARARSANSGLGRTTVNMTFTIDETGAVKTVDLRYRNRFDDAAKECMRDAAMSLHFPASMQGTQTGEITFSP